jgi:phosphoribosylaminoimidazolecarboxamide formyltransferase/IMP cyclohydrolase
LPVEPQPPPAKAEAALFSVYDRTGVVELARAVAASGMKIYATGGTHAHLRENGVDVEEVGSLTGFGSLFSGRVKTLHPKVFGGILSDRNDESHRDEAIEHNIPAIGLVVVNLYPFESTIARSEATLEEAIEQIDIGGVSLIRAAAKNFAHVTVLIDPDQYAAVVRAPQGVDDATRRRFATRAFERTADYDSACDAATLRRKSAVARRVLSRA